MAVITRFIVVRDGVELDQVFTDKKEAEAYDKMLDAAHDLSLLIKQGDLQIKIDTKSIDDIAIYLAKNASAVLKILKNVKPIEPSTKEKGKTTQGDPAEDKKKTQEPKDKAKSKAN